MTFSRRAFTMIELLAIIAIVAVIAAIALPWVGNYLDWTHKTALRHTVAVLNESLNEYRALGGIGKAHSLQGAVGTTKTHGLLQMM
jgi:prepilin-type N-terminal cleavage/methylation domain-containing protein